jgi:protein-tyrosine phosphatase
MDQANLRNLRTLFGGDPQNKLRLLLAYTDHPREVSDPWYTGDFEATWQDVLAGCRGVLEAVTGE